MIKRLVLRQIIPLFFVCLVASYAYYEYSKSQKSELDSEHSYFLTQPLESLSEIEIKKSGKKLHIVKKDQDWFLKEPIQDFASFSEVARWFDEIKNQKVQKIEIQGDVSWKNYYLEKSPQVKLKFSNDKSISFFVSSKLSFDEKSYIRKEDYLFIGEKYFFNEINQRDFMSFRSKRITPSLGHPIELKIQRGISFLMSWAPYTWSSKDKSFILDQKKLDSFWKNLSSIEVSSFKGRATPSLLSQYGLNQPQQIIRLKYSQNKFVTIKISALKNGKHYVHSSYRDFILEISKEDAKKLQVSKTDFIDFKKPFIYKKELAARIDLKSKDFSYVLEKKGEEWHSQSFKSKSIDSKKVQSFLNSIYDLEGMKYRKGQIKEGGFSLMIQDANRDPLLTLKASSLSQEIVWIQSQWAPHLLISVPKVLLDTIIKKDFYSEESEKKSIK